MTPRSRWRRRAPTPSASSRQRHLHLRYAGTEAALVVPLGDARQIVADFTAAHRARFGFATPDRPLVVEAVAVEALAAGEAVQRGDAGQPRRRRPTAIDTVRMFTGGDRARRTGVRPHRAAARAIPSPARR